MKKLSGMLVLLIAAALLLGACGGGASPASSGGAKPAPTEAVQSAEPTEPPAAKPTSSSSNANSNENESKPIELKDVTSGLDALSSYKSTFNMEFDGKDNGQPKTGSFQSVEEYVKNPPAKRTTFSGFGATSGTPEANAGDNMIQTIEVDGKQYSVFGKTCVSSDSAEAPKSTPSFQPSSIIGDIRGAQLVGMENVNGVPTAHYKGDVSPYAALGYLNANSDVWIAQPGDYVVKYVFEATGKDTFFGSSNSEGTLKWTYELSDINQPIDISAPKDCGGAAEDIPIMADAKDKSTFGGMNSYSSPSKFEDVAAFYEKEMAKNGWTENTEGGLSAEGMAQKTFTKEGRTVQVIITTDQSSGGTSVIIQEEKK